MNSIFHVRTGIEKGRIAANSNGSRIVVFNDHQLAGYRVEADALVETFRLPVERLADCAFVGNGKLAISTELSPPKVMDPDTGSILAQVAEPMKATPRSNYGRLFSRGCGDFYLRTSYPHLLIKMDAETLSPTKAIAAESVCEVAFHPHRDLFACVVDATSQEIAFGTFEEAAFYEFCLSELPYIYSFGMSRSGNNLCLLGSDGNSTLLQVINMESLESVGVRTVDLKLEETTCLTGNDSQVFIASKTLPVIGEHSALTFKAGGEAVLASPSSEVVLDSPHRTAITSVVQGNETGNIFSLDWDGLLAVWEALPSNAIRQSCDWKFLRGGKVFSSYETRSRDVLN